MEYLVNILCRALFPPAEIRQMEIMFLLLTFYSAGTSARGSFKGGIQLAERYKYGKAEQRFMVCYIY